MHVERERVNGIVAHLHLARVFGSLLTSVRVAVLQCSSCLDGGIWLLYTGNSRFVDFFSDQRTLEFTQLSSIAQVTLLPGKKTRGFQGVVEQQKSRGSPAAAALLAVVVVSSRNSAAGRSLTSQTTCCLASPRTAGNVRKEREIVDSPGTKRDAIDAELQRQQRT